MEVVLHAMVHEEVARLTDYKICGKCKQVKSINQFHVDNYMKDKRRHVCKVCVQVYNKGRYDKGLVPSSKYSREHHAKLKIEVIKYYSPNMVCVVCGFSDIRALSIDHIKGDGAEHRKVMKGNIYPWLKKNYFPNGFQVLCMNCQFIKRHENHEFRHVDRNL